MSAASPFVLAHNGEALPRARLPVVDIDAFRRAVIEGVAAGGRVAALFAPPYHDARTLVAVLAYEREGFLRIGSTELRGDAYSAMTPECAQVHLFEREIAEQRGVEPTGHPWLKPVRRVGATEFYRVQGDETHEVGVGPIHAGVIEPGHFRFQCDGERVIHLEIALGYQHRGVERALVGGPDKRSVHYVETAAGDTTVGHATAYALVLEGLGDAHIGARSQAIRGIALELERLANHTGGLGALANDVGFLPTAAFCGRLRGEFLNLTAHICGSRFGRGLVRAGRGTFAVDAERAKEMVGKLETASRDLHEALELLWNASSVQTRFEDAGPVTLETARELGLVGVAARACGIERDVRRDFPAGVFQFAQIPLTIATSGDVFARAFVRTLECQRSVAFVRKQLQSLPDADRDPAVVKLRPDHVCVGLVEGWRGEICHVGITDSASRFASYKIVDPSFHNWMGLAMALREQEISDFPLCNKSFDLSYCGTDL